MRGTELCKWRCCSETWTIMYQTVRRPSSEDSIIYCYRYHDVASHMECRSHCVCSLRRHFSEHKVESWGGIVIWLVVQGRGANQRRKSEEMLLFLNYGILEWRCVCVCVCVCMCVCVCGDGADYQFSTYFLLFSILSPNRQYPNPKHFNSSVHSL